MLPVPGQMIISVALAIIFTAPTTQEVPHRARYELFADFYRHTTNPLCRTGECLRFTTPHISWVPGFWEQNRWTLNLRRRGPGLPNRWTRSGSRCWWDLRSWALFWASSVTCSSTHCGETPFADSGKPAGGVVVNEPASRRSEAKPPAAPVAPPPAPKDRLQ